VERTACFHTPTSYWICSVISYSKRINQPRPYEKWAIQPLLAKDTSGKSMPSRHVFSATVISMCLFYFFWLPGLICLLLSAGLAAVRVIGGVHYPKDVLVGYLCGICWGALLFLL